MAGGKFKKQRTRLWKENPHCFYCKCLTILPEDLPVEHGYASGKLKNVPDDMATIEHIYSRLNPSRWIRGKRVLACYKCNNEKSREEELALPIEVRRQITEAKNSKERRGVIKKHYEKKFVAQHLEEVFGKSK